MSDSDLDSGPDSGVAVAAVDRILSKLDELSGEVADLRVSVARLEERVDQRHVRPKGAGGRGSVAAGGLLGAALGGLISHFTSK
jgi:hypothetical protein